MGQVQSGTATAENAAETAASSPSTPAANDNTSPSSLDSLIAEAAAFGEAAENESLEAKALKALECPCISHLRSGPCGSQFSDAFLCFLKSTAEEKGSDCVPPFVALQKSKHTPMHSQKTFWRMRKSRKRNNQSKNTRFILPFGP